MTTSYMGGGGAGAGVTLNSNQIKPSLSSMKHMLHGTRHEQGRSGNCRPSEENNIEQFIFKWKKQYEVFK